MLLVKCSTHFRLFCLEVTSLLIILTLIPLRRDGKFVATFNKFLVNPKPLYQSCKGMNQKVWHAFQYSVANKSLLLNVLQFIFRFIQKQSPRRLLKKRLWHKCFPVNFAKFPRTPFFTEHLWWLLLFIAGKETPVNISWNSSGEKFPVKFTKGNKSLFYYLAHITTLIL